MKLDEFAWRLDEPQELVHWQCYYFLRALRDKVSADLGDDIELQLKEKQGEKSEAPGETWRWQKSSSSFHRNKRRRTSTGGDTSNNDEHPSGAVNMFDCPEEDSDGDIAEDTELMGMLPAAEWDAFRALFKKLDKERVQKNVLKWQMDILQNADHA